MTLTMVFRDVMETLESQLRSNWWGQPNQIRLALETGWHWVEASLQTLLSFVFQGGWLRQITELPILAPELALARATGNANTTLRLDIQNWSNPSSNAFQSGLRNSLLLGLPLTLSHILALRRASLQGLPRGWTATIGYRIGEVLALQARRIGGWRWWGLSTLEPLPLFGGLFLTALLLWDVTRTGGERNRRLTQQGFLLIRRLHFAYAWTEQGVLLGSLGAQSLDVVSSSARFYVGANSRVNQLSYSLGLLLGGLRRDALFLAARLRILERILLWLRCPPEAWRRTLDQWSRRGRVALALASLPFYTADYLRLNPFGFSARDTDVARALTRVAFSVPMPRPNEPVPLQFEGRTILKTDSYGRPAPDVVRDPWHMAQPAVESLRDNVEETYATRSSNQRVDSVYLGSLERTVFEWLSRRGGNERTRGNRERIPVAEPVRIGLGRETAPAAQTLGDSDRLAVRLERWYRASRARRREGYALQLPLERRQKHPEGLTALYQTGLERPRYFAGSGLVEPYRAIRYESPSELSMKRNARRSPLHRAPVQLYMDTLLLQQPKGLVTSRSQQQGLYRARLALADYLAAARRYREAEQNSTGGWDVSGRVSQRGVWQREVFQRFFGGVRSRSSTVYSQQYTGNLHLARRLFAVSWENRENRLPTRSITTDQIRRKFRLDQLTLQSEKAPFEHEELGGRKELKVRTGNQRLLSRNAGVLGGVGRESTTSSETSPRDGQWLLLPGQVDRPQRNVQAQPLYAGWDNERRTLVLCNRYLPFEQALRGGVQIGEQRPDVLSRPRAQVQAGKVVNSQLRSMLRQRSNFTVWPLNRQSRRMRTTNSRYPLRAILRRRLPTREVRLLSRDRSRWARGSYGNAALAQFAFWFNPRSAAMRNPRDLTPIRSSQAFPVALERTARVGLYSAGDLQPSGRGGLLWPGTDRLQLLQANYFRPGAPSQEPTNARSDKHSLPFHEIGKDRRVLASFSPIGYYFVKLRSNSQWVMTRALPFQGEIGFFLFKFFPIFEFGKTDGTLFLFLRFNRLKKRLVSK